MTPITRAAALFLFAFAQPAFAQSSCPLTVDRAEFESKGGKLVEVRQMNIGDVPHRRFYCGILNCNGGVDFSGYIDGDGVVHVMKTGRNYWKREPAWHARVVRRLLARMRYAPPSMNGRPVCVRMSWPIIFASSETEWRR